jgi:hypothetical protein
MTVRDALNRELYRGRLIWNRRRRVMRGGRRAKETRPESEWVTLDVPGLRIVSDAQWQAAHERLADSRRVYLEATGGAGAVRPLNGVESGYLLTGFVACGACGGTMFAHRHGHKNRRFFSYLCTQHHVRGRAVCKNGLEANMRHADRAVLDAVERDLFRIEVLETSLAKAVGALQAPGDQDHREGALRHELARLELEVARLAAAIAAGGDLPALVALLRGREQRRSQVQMAIAALRRTGPRVRPLEELVDELRGHLSKWRALLHQETGPARQALRPLLAGRLIFTPQEQNGERFYTFEGPGTISPVIAGVLPKAFVSPP